jgi:hypothetical protein
MKAKPSFDGYLLPLLPHLQAPFAQPSDMATAPALTTVFA